MEIPSLIRRLGALLIDWVIAALSAVAIAGVSYPPAPLDKDPSQTFIIIGFFVLEVGVLTGLLGRSIGKRLLGMKIENRDGEPIGVPRALLRTLRGDRRIGGIRLQQRFAKRFRLRLRCQRDQRRPHQQTTHDNAPQHAIRT